MKPIDQTKIDDDDDEENEDDDDEADAGRGFRAGHAGYGCRLGVSYLRRVLHGFISEYPKGTQFTKEHLLLTRILIGIYGIYLSNSNNICSNICWYK